MTALTGWQNFYVILGSSAGALIGLQFVVITLIADAPRHPDMARAGTAFGTPTIVHFGAVLLVSAVASAPWGAARDAAIAWGVMGAAGVVYLLMVTGRMRTQRAYKPEAEDWVFYSVLPLFGYVVLLASAPAARSHPSEALFFVAAAALLLLFVGIHNAWDSVTYHVFSSGHRGDDATPPQ